VGVSATTWGQGKGKGDIRPTLDVACLVQPLGGGTHEIVHAGLVTRRAATILHTGPLSDPDVFTELALHALDIGGKGSPVASIPMEGNKIYLFQSQKL
jgi:hypothetical protein